MGQSWSESLGECSGSREKPELPQPMVDEKLQLEFTTWPKTSASRITGRKCVTSGTYDMAQCPEQRESSSSLREAMACGGCLIVPRPIPSSSMHRFQCAPAKNAVLLHKFGQLSADILCLQGLGEVAGEEPTSPSRPEEFLSGLMSQGYNCSPALDAIPACSDGRLNRSNYVMTPASQCVLYDRERFEEVASNTLVLQQGATAQEVRFI